MPAAAHWAQLCSRPGCSSEASPEEAWALGSFSLCASAHGASGLGALLCSLPPRTFPDTTLSQDPSAEEVTITLSVSSASGLVAHALPKQMKHLQGNPGSKTTPKTMLLLWGSAAGRVSQVLTPQKWESRQRRILEARRFTRLLVVQSVLELLG